MSRRSIHKVSTFKLQAMRTKYQHFLQCIDESVVVKRFPYLKQIVKQTSQQVYDICYSFSDDSPFIKGLNYHYKCIGFSRNQNILNYNEWLPGINEAYLIGDFNNFNKQYLKLQKNEESDWFKIEIDLKKHHIQNGSRILLRVINHKGQQCQMIPPSCYIINNNYGIYSCTDTTSQQHNKLRIKSLLAYTIDLQIINLKQCCQFIEKQSRILQCYNTIIIKNLFKNNNGLLHKFVLTISEQKLLAELIEKIKNDLRIKVILEWNFEEGHLHYQDNAVENVFMLNKGNSYTFNTGNKEVLAYYLANISHYYYEFGIDGMHFTRVGQLVHNNADGYILMKCINTLINRLSDQNITLGSSKQQVPGITESIIEGGFGFNFTYNYHKSLLMSSDHFDMNQKFQKVHHSSNCLAINFNNINQTNSLNLLFTFMMSNQGVFTTGNFTNIKQCLRKILKLRRQTELFKQPSKIIKIDNRIIIVKRGKSLLLFNFTNWEVNQYIANISKMCIIFNNNQSSISINNNDIITIDGNNCLLLEEDN